MTLERRKFGILCAAGGIVFWRWHSDPAGLQSGTPQQHVSPPERVLLQEGIPDHSAETLKAALEERQIGIKKDVQRLYEIATQLKNEVEKTDSSKILSLNLVKRAEEAEKLAKHLKGLARD